MSTQSRPVLGRSASSTTRALLGLLGTNGLRAQTLPASRPPPETSASTILSLINAGVPSSQIAQLIQSPRLPPTPATASLDLDTLIRLQTAQVSASSGVDHLRIALAAAPAQAPPADATRRVVQNPVPPAQLVGELSHAGILATDNPGLILKGLLKETGKQYSLFKLNATKL